MTVVPNGLMPSSTDSLMSSQSPETGLDAKTIQQLNKQKDQREFVSWALGEYKRAKTARVAFERQWYMNMAFFQGRQWVVYPQTMGASAGPQKLILPKAPPYRVRQTINRCRSVVR